MELFDKKFVYLEWDDALEGKKVVIGDTLGELKKKLHSMLFDSVMENKEGDYPFTPSEDDMNFAMAYYDPNYECKVAYAQGKVIQCRNKGDNKWMVTSSPNWVDGCEYCVKPEEPAVIPEMWTACIDDEGVISSMPACEWNKSKGRQLIEGTREKCEIFAIENYCNKCAYHAACIGQKCTMNLDMWYCQGFRELNAVKKRRMTNRELAQWLAQGNGQVKDINSSTITSRGLMYDDGDDDKPCPNYLVIRVWDETEWSEPTVEEE